MCCRATQLSIVSDRATRIELLSISSVGETPVDVFSTVFMIRCTMGNCSYRARVRRKAWHEDAA